MPASSGIVSVGHVDAEERIARLDARRLERSGVSWRDACRVQALEQRRSSAAGAT